MDAPVYKKLTDIENHQENPFGTKEGQTVVSIGETFWGRLARHGRPKSSMSAPMSITNTATYSNVLTITPNIGNIFYPRAVTIAVTQPAIAIVHIQTYIDFMNNGTLTSDPTYRMVRIAPNTPFIFFFDGEYFVGSGAGGTGYVQMKILPDAPCTAWSSIDGFEVMPDA